jgi:hypothetical protein
LFLQKRKLNLSINYGGKTFPKMERPLIIRVKIHQST